MARDSKLCLGWMRKIQDIERSDPTMLHIALFHKALLSLACYIEGSCDPSVIFGAFDIRNKQGQESLVSARSLWKLQDVTRAILELDQIERAIFRGQDGAQALELWAASTLKS